MDSYEPPLHTDKIRSNHMKTSKDIMEFYKKIEQEKR